MSSVHFRSLSVIATADPGQGMPCIVLVEDSIRNKADNVSLSPSIRIFGALTLGRFLYHIGKHERLY